MDGGATNAWPSVSTAPPMPMSRTVEDFINCYVNTTFRDAVDEAGKTLPLADSSELETVRQIQIRLLTEKAFSHHIRAAAQTGDQDLDRSVAQALRHKVQELRHNLCGRRIHSPGIG